jgi:hypothetical protein
LFEAVPKDSFASNGPLSRCLSLLAATAVMEAIAG